MSIATAVNCNTLWGIRHADGSVSVFEKLKEATQNKARYADPKERIIKFGIVDEDPVEETEVEVTSYMFSYSTKTGTSGAVSYNRRETAEGDRQYMIVRGTSCSELQEIKQKIKVQKKLNA